MINENHYNFNIGEIYKKPTAVAGRFAWVKIVGLPRYDEDGAPFMLIDVYSPTENRWLAVEMPQYLDRPSFTQGWQKVRRAMDT